MTTLFEQRLKQNLEDPEFRAAFERDRHDIARVQELLTRLDDAREEAGLTKAGLARLTGTHPAAVRKLLTSGEGNPNLLHFLRMLDATGLELRIVGSSRSRSSAVGATPASGRTRTRSAQRALGSAPT